jgi:uncharacterized phiE125 gp8 family phage protein
MSLLSLKRITEPDSTPVCLSEVKSWLRIDSGFSDDDGLVTGLIYACTDRAEDYLGRSLVSQQWRFNLDFFPSYGFHKTAPANNGGYSSFGSWWTDSQAIYLPRCPLISVDAITYTAVDGTTQTLDPNAYQVDGDSEPARILPAYNAYWPVALMVPNAISISFTAGYEDRIPEVLKVAIKLMITALFENPSDFYLGVGAAVTIPLAAERLMAAHRISSFDYSPR